MKIYSPVQSCQINQGFGALNTSPDAMPIYKAEGLLGHNGFDFGVRCKDMEVIHGGQCDPIYCNVEGDGELTVVYIQKDDATGYGVTVLDDKWNKFLWWHEDSFDPLVQMGMKIKPGQLLGISGNTGKSTGAHVHFGFYPYGADPKNGYDGAEDPTPYYDNRFVLDIEKQIGIIEAIIQVIQNLINLFK
jgi:hypothetical protein